MPRRSRVLVVRVSRFVERAQAMAASTWPDGEHRVLPVPAGRKINVLSLFTSRWGVEAMAWRPDVVVTQWWDKEGNGHEAVDGALLVLQPRGFHVVFADGTTQWISGVNRVRRSLQRHLRTLRGAVIVLALAVAAAAAWTARLCDDRTEQAR